MTILNPTRAAFAGVLDAVDSDTDFKVRKVFNSLEQAIDFAKQKGGRIARPTKSKLGKVFWYSMKYTMGDIMKDTSGDYQIGTWKDFTSGGQFSGEA
jgi:muramoyltetrapeptide carboxypeptidase LdcA involved in peptidoglycan recycling